MDATQTPFPATLAAHAAAAPDAPAVSDPDGTYSRRELDELSNRWARAMAERGVGEGDVVSICLPSDRRFVVAAWAAWKTGATPQPLSSRIAPQELREIIDLTKPALLLGAAPDGANVTAWDGEGAESYSAEPLPHLASPSWKAPTSGGSTGRPKIIFASSPAITEQVAGLAALIRMGDGDVVLIPAPMHHNGPFMFSSLGVLTGGHVVLMPRFDPEAALELIARHKVTWIYAVPTIMSRIAKLPAEITAVADTSSVHTMFHMAAPCPDWLKRWWIDKIGADAVWEVYAGTEAQAITVINGSEWLERPTSVGKVLAGEMVILDEAGEPLPDGEIGEIFMRAPGGATTYHYVGADARVVNGFESLGDMGWMDEAGYLFLSDRKTDMVLVGGVNVYPAEVESAIEAHPAVGSVCVIGLPDEDVGNRLHAIIQATSEVSDDDLLAFISDRLAPYKRPRSFERVDEPLRDEAGKMRRSALREARLQAAQ